MTMIAYGQGPMIVKHFVGAPTGGCYPNYTAIDDSNGDQYNCLSGAWHQINGGGGSGTVTNVATAGPILGGPITTTGTISCQAASGSLDGCLSSSDWTTFNSKQSALSFPLTFTQGGTNQTSFTASRCVRTDVSGTFFESSPGDCGATPNITQDGLVSGGSVAWKGTNFDFTVQAAVYVIGGQTYNSAQTDVTLDPADPQDRFDVIAVDDIGSVVVLKGTAAPNPVKPVVDPATQLELTFIRVNGGSTVPVITNENIYLEDVEWTCASSGTGTYNCASTNNPYAGTKDVETTAVAKNSYVQFTAPAPITLSNYVQLVFYIRSKAAWNSQRSISISWLSGTTAQGNAVVLKDGTLGFASTNTTSYQQIAIPVASFGTISGTTNVLRFTVAGGGTATIGYYLDNVILQSGDVTPPPPATGITSLNGLTAQVQSFATGTSGTDFNIASVVSTHTFNLPTASASVRGALSSADWSTFNGKQNALSFPLSLANGGTAQNTWTASRCVQVNAGGTALESAAGACGSGAGTVTSVGLALPSTFTVTNSPVTATGTLTGSYNVAAADYVVTSTAANTAAWGQINSGSSCGDGSHAVSYDTTTHLFGCQALSIPGAINFADNEVPSGSINSSNQTFTLAHTPSPAASLSCYANGIEWIAGGADFTLATATITTVGTLQTGDTLICSYRY